MDNEFHIVGKVSKDGKLLISGIDEMNDFLSKWKNAKIVGTFKVFNPGGKEAMIGYYYGKILPDIQRAYFELGNQFSIEDTDLQLRVSCPMGSENVHQLSREQLKSYIEWIQQFASENLNLILTD